MNCLWSICQILTAPTSLAACLKLCTVQIPLLGPVGLDECQKIMAYCHDKHGDDTAHPDETVAIRAAQVLPLPNSIPAASVASFMPLLNQMLAVLVC